MNNKLIKQLLIISLLISILIVQNSCCGKPSFTKFDYKAIGDKLHFDLRIECLKKSSKYALCINGKEGQDGNLVLIKYFKRWENEGYYDFAVIFSDKKRNLVFKDSVKDLPKSKYHVTFVVKDVENNGNSILFIDDCKFEIK